MITTVNNHVLFPHLADWSTQPDTSRQWQTEISDGLPGSELRQAMRAASRRSLAFTFTAHSLEERTRFDARWDAALKIGLACSPFFGRSCVLDAAADAEDLSIEVSPGAWTWAVGDYVCLILNDETFDVAKITNVAGTVLTLETALDFAWLEGARVWPLIFGKLQAETSAPFTSWHQSLSLRITQLVSERTAQLGELEPVVGTGIDFMEVGNDFEVA